MTDLITEPAPPSLGRSDIAAQASILLGTLVVAAALHTRHFIGDGIRYLPHLDRPLPEHGGVSHAAYPILAWLWGRLGTTLGAPSVLARLGAEFPALIWFQWLNALGAAVGALAFFSILRRCDVGRPEAIGLTVALTLSNAYVLAATDMIEPMWALTLSCVAVLVALAPLRPLARALGSGVVLGMAGWFYQLGLVPGLLVAGALVVAGVPSTRSLLSIAAAAGASIVTFATGVFVFVSLLGRGNDTPLVETASGLFGRVHPKHLVGALFGAANGFAPLQDWLGLSGLFRGPRESVAANLFVLVLFAVSMISLVAVRASCPVRHRALALFAIANLVSVWVFAGFWESAYVKVWLFALPAFFILLGLTMPAQPRARLRRLLPLGLLVALSLLQTVRRAITEPPDMVTARGLATQVGDKDLLISPGWDGPSVYLHTLLRPDLHRFSLTDSAIACRLDELCTAQALREALAEAERAGVRAWVFALLDLSVEDWAPFYGARLRLPREILGGLRKRSGEPLPVKGTVFSLREVGP